MKQSKFPPFDKLEKGDLLVFGKHVSSFFFAIFRQFGIRSNSLFLIQSQTSCKMKVLSLNLCCSLKGAIISVAHKVPSLRKKFCCHITEIFSKLAFNVSESVSSCTHKINLTAASLQHLIIVDYVTPFLLGLT